MDNDSKAIADFLHLSRDSIESISHLVAGGESIIEVTLRAERRPCPECGSARVASKGIRAKAMRHCLFLNSRTTITVKKHRFFCRDCGKTFTQDDGIGAPGARTTREIELEAVAELMSYNETFASVGKRLGVSDTTVISIFDRLVNPKRKPLPKILSIDECYGDGQFDEPYALILMDWSSKKIADVLEGRDKRHFSSYLFNQTSLEERAGVEYVVTDMWEPYREIARRYFPNAKHVVDSFHVMENLCRALSRIRCRAQARYGKGTYEYHYLKESAKLIFRDDLRMDAKKRKDPYTGRYLNAWDIVREAEKADPELALARGYYLRYKFFNSRKAKSYEAALDGIDAFRSDEKAARVPELFEFMTTLGNWREEIAMSLVAYVGERRISNGPMEGQNSQFSKLMVVSNGVRNFSRFRARLMLCYNKDCAFSPLPSGAKPRKKAGKKRGKYHKKKGEAE